MVDEVSTVWSGVADATRARDGTFRGLRPTANVSRRYRGEDLL